MLTSESFDVRRLRLQFRMGLDDWTLGRLPQGAGGTPATSGGSGKGSQKKRLPAGAGVGGPVPIGCPLPGPAPEQQQGDPFVRRHFVNNSEAVFGSSL